MPDRHMNYIETEAPEGLTLVEWRNTRIEKRPRRRIKIRTWVPRLRPAFA